jgi:hypothetical protein
VRLSAAERVLFNYKKSRYSATIHRFSRRRRIIEDNGNGPQAAHPIGT